MATYEIKVRQAFRDTGETKGKKWKKTKLVDTQGRQFVGFGDKIVDEIATGYVVKLEANAGNGKDKFDIVRIIEYGPGGPDPTETKPVPVLDRKTKVEIIKEAMATMTDALGPEWDAMAHGPLLAEVAHWGYGEFVGQKVEARRGQ